MYSKLHYANIFRNKQYTNFAFQYLNDATQYSANTFSRKKRKEKPLKQSTSESIFLAIVLHIDEQI